MLQPSSPSKHNAMRRVAEGSKSHKPGQRISHPASTNFHASASDGSPPAKRLKRSPSPSSPTLASPRKAASSAFSATTPKGARVTKQEIPDSDADSGADETYGADDDHGLLQPPHRPTDLETALPAIATDAAAIEAYELSRHQRPEEEEKLSGRGVAEEAEKQAEDVQTRFSSRRWRRGHSSIYVDAFHLALQRVLAEEAHLFSGPERAVFAHWDRLSYPAQYLYVRLFLRKAAAWHRVRRLGYYGDVADLEAAVAELQAGRELPGLEETEGEGGERFAGEERGVGKEAELEESFSFADRSEDCIRDLDEASSLLLLDELKAFAKDARVQGKNKKELLAAFRRTSGKQRGLGFSSLKRSETEETTATEASVNEGSEREDTPSKAENRDAHWVGKILAETGPCIRLSLPTQRLFERVHLVFYRSTEWTEKSLTTIILAGIARRNFPEYIVSRSANIFPSRSLLLEFEAAVRTQFRVDSILEFNGTPTREGLRTVLDIFDEVYPRWRALLAEEQRKEDSIYSTGEGAYLRRLSPAWVYTRIVHKGAYVLGKTKAHAREHAVLVDLLSQRLFHTSRRGDWYQRKALLEEHYMHLHLASPASCRDDEDAKRKFWRRAALETCEAGLQDNLTHLIFHRDLQKRTTKLEKALKVPKRLQHEFAHVRLTTPAERTFTGVRIERAPSAAAVRRNSDQTSSHRGAKTIWLDPELSHNPPDDASAEGQAEREGECSVENMCLSSYRALGWKGYHSEGGILRTLFAYLFHDVLFLYMPNVFQTEFQTCPLDLHTDAFYPSRLSEVHARLNEISNGGAPGLIAAVHAAHAARRTCVVGLDWSFALPDLLEIAAAFPAPALSLVMKVLAQEYAQRGGGVPDLFLWRPPTRTDSRADGGGDEETPSSSAAEVLFAEVKSENDRLSDSQRMWIDVLCSAGVRVELCHAVAREVRVR